MAKKENKKENKKKTGSKGVSAGTVKTLKLSAVIIVVLLLILIAAAQFGGVTLSTIGDYFSTSIARIGAGDGFPYSVGGAEIEDVVITNSDLALLDGDSVKVLNSTAKEISDLKHTYDHPVMDSNSGRILLYDMGGTKLRVQSKTRVLYEKTMDHIILTGAIGKDGSIAVASRADGAESKLTVFDKQHEEAFVWLCSREHIVSCDVSDNGRYFTAAVVGVENGAVYSKVYLFDKKSSEPIAAYDYKDSAVTTVRFLSNETVMIIGNNICEIVNSSGVMSKVDVTVNTPSRLYISDNNTAVLVLSKYSGTTQKIVKVYDKTGAESFSVDIDGMVKSVHTDGNYVAVLTDSRLRIFNMEGEMCGSADVNTDAEKVLVASRRTYVYKSDRIDMYSSVGDNKDTE